MLSESEGLPNIFKDLFIFFIKFSLYEKKHRVCSPETLRGILKQNSPSLTLNVDMLYKLLGFPGARQVFSAGILLHTAA